MTFGLEFQKQQGLWSVIQSGEATPTFPHSLQEYDLHMYLHSSSADSLITQYLDVQQVVPKELSSYKILQFVPTESPLLVSSNC